MTYSTTLKALASSTRRALFERVAEQPLSVGQLADEFLISQPAVSQHLKVLREARLVDLEQRGARHIYHANPEGIEALRSYLDQFWDDVLNAFADDTKPEDKDT